MKRPLLFKLAILSFAACVGFYPLAPLAPAFATETSTAETSLRYWTIEELEEFAAAFATELETSCHGDTSCEERLTRTRRDEDPRFNLLDMYRSFKIIFTTINPATETIRILYQDNDEMARWTGEISDPRPLSELYVAWLDPSAPDPTVESVGASGYPAFVSDMQGGITDQGTHALLMRVAADSESSVIPADTEVKFSVTGGDLASNSLHRVYYAASIGTWKTHNVFDYSDCVHSLSYQFGMECRYVFYEDYTRGYVPSKVNSDAATIAQLQAELATALAAAKNATTTAETALAAAREAAAAATSALAGMEARIKALEDATQQLSELVTAAASAASAASSTADTASSVASAAASAAAEAVGIATGAASAAAAATDTANSAATDAATAREDAATAMADATAACVTAESANLTAQNTATEALAAKDTALAAATETAAIAAELSHLADSARATQSALEQSVLESAVLAQSATKTASEAYEGALTAFQAAQDTASTASWGSADLRARLQDVSARVATLSTSVSTVADGLSTLEEGTSPTSPDASTEAVTIPLVGDEPASTSFPWWLLVVFVLLGGSLLYWWLIPVRKHRHQDD